MIAEPDSLGGHFVGNLIDQSRGYIVHRRNHLFVVGRNDEIPDLVRLDGRKASLRGRNE